MTTDQLNQNIFSESDAKLIVSIHNDAQETAIEFLKALEKGKLALVEAHGKQLSFDLAPIQDLKILEILKTREDTQELKNFALNAASSLKTILNNEDSILFSLAKSACHLANEGLNRIENDKLIKFFVANNEHIREKVDFYKDNADFFKPLCEVVETYPGSAYDSNFAALEAKIIDLVDTLSHPYTSLFDL
jgi:hypothetical protein